MIIMDSTDTRFIVNEKNKTLYDRFNVLIRNTSLFDCLVGYFYSSGFYLMVDSLKNTDKIRILIGIGTDSNTSNQINKSKLEPFFNSSKQIKEKLDNSITDEYENSKDKKELELGVNLFLNWLKSKKLEIKAYPEQNLHSKLYILSYKDGFQDKGRVITGSSNFSKSGLKDNFEFNVELKDYPDYKFAKDKFDELWETSIDVSDVYINSIETKTWLNTNITPYELYLKFLYEYFKDEINKDNEFDDLYFPKQYLNLKYQTDAVNQAKSKLEQYGGVFLSDVVGLGKTYMSALLAQKLTGNSLIITPPALLDEDKPGSWPNVFREFGVRGFKVESIGKLDKLIKNGVDNFDNVFIDEAHRFRNDSTQMYEKLHQICHGKKIILVTATPLNNTPMDILSQISLFQDRHHSTLPNPKVRDLEVYFKNLQKKLDNLDRSVNKEEYLKVIKSNAKDIRENVLKYIMVRRTRNGVSKYYSEDLKKQNLKFPTVESPCPVYYSFDSETNKVFDETLDLIINKFKYSRYMALTYLKESLSEIEKQSQKNMGNFMKGLLLKRLESSFYAFKKSVNRFIKSYEHFIKIFETNKKVYISKNINKIFDLLDNDDLESIQKLIDKEDAKEYSADKFNSLFIKDLKEDLKILKQIKDKWNFIYADPKLDEFIDILKNDKILRNNKLIVFSESKETVEYLSNQLNKKFSNCVLPFYSNIKQLNKNELISNFDARSKNKKNNFRILITTDILAEGVNLHQASVIINYDIPWNPIKMMQRVGRINRVDTPHEKLYTYNFFPTGVIDDKIKLKDAAEAKIEAFIEMLGNDSKILTDEPIKSHNLFNKLISKDILDDSSEDDDEELKYLQIIRNIRDKDDKLFSKIKKLPKKSRTAKNFIENKDKLITFLRKGKLKKIFITEGLVSNELNFVEAIKYFESDINVKKEKVPDKFYDYLKINKDTFDNIFYSDQNLSEISGRGRSNESQLLKYVKAINNSNVFTEDDDTFIFNLINLLNKGSLPKKIIQKSLNHIKKNKSDNSLKILSILKSNIPSQYLNDFKSSANTFGPREVILSEWLIRK